MAEGKVRSKSIGHYVLLKTIGEGTFGKVKLGTHILTGERVAVKVLEKERFVDIADVERVAREIHILKLIRHPHIIQLYEIIETPKQLYLIMEYAPGGELFDYIVNHGRAEEQEACRFLHQILAGIEKVHAMSVVHRDLKPENLLLDEHKDIKIVDFGLSNTYEDGQLLQTACGSPCYAAPEMIAGHKYVPSMVDIWSCGVILFALVCGYLPFESNEQDQNHAELYKKILEADYEMPNYVSAEVADLIAGMLTTDPEKRLTLDGVRQHKWYCQMQEASIPDYEDKGIMDEEILEQLDSYGFPRDYAVKCLKTNKHNHATTTYYLLKEKKHVRKAVESRDGRDAATNLAIADLEATGVEELPFGAATAAAVAAVATPSRGYRAEAAEQPPRRKRPGSAPGRGGPRDAAAVNGAARSSRHNDGSQTARGAPQPQWHDHAAAQGSMTSRGGSSGSVPVPKLNLGGMGQDDGSGADRASGSTAPSTSSRRNSAAAAAAADAEHRYRSASPSTRRGVSPVPRRVSQTPRGRPMSARGHSASGRRPSADRGGYQQRAGSPYTVGGYRTGMDDLRSYGAGGYMGGVDYYSRVPGQAREPDTSPHWDAPLTARARLQSNLPPSYRDRPASARPGASPAAWGNGPVRAVGPMTARGPRGSVGGEDARESGSCSMSVNSSLPPKETVKEALRALAAQRVAFRHVSGFLIRCQAKSAMFEAEVLQLSKGGGYVLRFSRVSGDVFQYKETCAQLLSQMNL